MNQKNSVTYLALLAGFCAAVISFFAPFYAYGVDSASYLDQARSLMARGVFEIIPYGTGTPDVMYEPDKLFPPGYPLLIVFASLLLQLPVAVVAPYLSLAALALLPCLFVLSFHRVLGLLPALWLSLLVVFTPAAIRHGFVAYSDLISLAWVIYATHRLLMAGHQSINWFWLGLLTGSAYLLRNANLGLLLTIGLYLGWQFIVESENRKVIIRNGLVWLGANAMLIVPWLVRNYFVFGKLQPYWMPPSTVSLGENTHDYLIAQLDTLLAYPDLDRVLAGEPWGLFVLSLLLAVLTFQVIVTWQRWQKIEQQTFLIAFVYAGIGAAMVIAARTQYQWGVHISARHVLSYACFIVVAIAIILKNSTVNKNRRFWGPGLIVALLLTRAFALPKLYEFDQYHQTILAAAKHIDTQQDVICNELHGRFAVSNVAFVYRSICGAPVRHVFPALQNNKFMDDSLPGWAELGAKQGIVVSLFPSVGDSQSSLPLQQDAVIKLTALGWQVERNEKDNLVLSHPAAFPP